MDQNAIIKAMHKLVAQLKNEISKTYKIDQEALAEVIEKHTSLSPELLLLLSSEKNLDKIRRTKIFKDFYKKLKKNVYYSLRTYQRGDKKHVSSAERTNYMESFIEQLHEYIKSANSILDIGGGMFPQSFPFKKYPNIKNYTWLDKDKLSFEKLMEFKNKNDFGQLNLICEKIGARNLEHFDLVFMLKLIPVINRQEDNLLEYLAKIPGNTVVVTGSKEAMVKKKNIQIREDIILKKFIAQTGRKVIKEIDIENEFGYVIS